MTFEEMQAMQEIKSARQLEALKQQEKLANEERAIILKKYGLTGDVSPIEKELKSTFDKWVKKFSLRDLEASIKEYRYFYNNVLEVGKKTPKPFSWQELTNIILKYDRTFVHRIAQIHVKLTKKFTDVTKTKIKETTEVKQLEKLQEELTKKKELANKITKEIIATFKKKNEKEGGRLKLDDSKAKDYFNNAIALYTLLAGVDGLGELAPVFDNVTSRTQDFWKDTDPATLKALIQKLTTNLYTKNGVTETLTNAEIVTISESCGTFFKECDAERLAKVADEYMQFRENVLERLIDFDSKSDYVEKLYNLTFKDLLIQAPTIGCKDSMNGKFNFDLLSGKDFKESLKDAPVDMDDKTQYLFKEFSHVKVGGTPNDLASLLIKAPTSACVSPYTIVDVVNFVDSTFKNSRYAHSTIKEELLTVNNFSDLNLVRTKNLYEDNCLPKLTTLFR